MSALGGARARAALLSVGAAALTAAAAAGLGASAWHAWGAAAYLGLTLVALALPAAIGVQVVGGQVLVASLVAGREAGPEPADPLLLLPLVVGVVLSAELLAATARLAHPLRSEPRSHLREPARATLLAGGAFVAVALVAGLPGPTGLPAVAVASAACVAVALLLTLEAR